MEKAGTIRVAMVRGPGAPERDGVSDYVAHLREALVGVRVEAVDVPGDSGWWPGATARTIRRLRPDLVHVQFAPAAYRFAPLPLLLPGLLPAITPLVTTVHEYGWWAYPGWVPRRLWRAVEARRVWDRETGRLVPGSRAVIVTNSGHAGTLAARTGTRAVEIPLAANVDRHGEGSASRAETRRRLGLPPDRFLLVFFGFVHPVKGVRYLLEALPALRADRPDLHLVVAGGFTSQALPEREAQRFRVELLGRCVECGVSDAVTFTGYLPAPAVSALLRCADAGVLPFTAGVTDKSGALLAMLDHGLPTAVTIPDEAPDPLRDGQTVAVIRRRRDPGAVVETLHRLVTDEALRQRLAAAGPALMAGRSWATVAAAHRNLYERVLEPYGA
jgi:glycosyltransferase involved in cell wall biosynthesis